MGSSRICLECRLLLHEGERCAAHSNAVALDDPALAAAVWQASPVARVRPAMVSRALAAGVKSAMLGAAVTVLVSASFSMCSDHPTRELTSAGWWVFAAVLLVIVVPALIVEQIRQHRVTLRDFAEWLFPPQRPQPLGAPDPKRPAGIAARGRVVGEPSLRAPISNTHCLGWAASVGEQGQVFLRAARAAAFRIELEDGSVVSIEAGPVAFFPSARSFGSAARWLDALHPERSRSSQQDPFPSTSGWDAVILPGDEIEVLGELESMIDDERGAYRAGATVLRPRGPVVLRSPAR